MRLSFAWWNTSLSPPTGNRKLNDAQKEFAFEVVKYLTCVLKVDFLALGEVSESDLDELYKKLNLNDYELYDGTLKSGRLQFDTGAIYRKSAFTLVNWTSLTSSRGRHSLKVANRLDLVIQDTSDPLHIFLSHWPSRLWCEKNCADRHLLGIRLNDAVQEVYKAYSVNPYIILLGDYNDEPFDSSLSEQLLAVRDRNLARKYPQLLYNPFWRHLGEALPYQHGSQCDRHSGSCFHSSGIETQWKTFDQIIFSSAFIGGREWHLNETFTQILEVKTLVKNNLATGDIFDHYPVLSVIEREV